LDLPLTYKWPIAREERAHSPPYPSKSFFPREIDRIQLQQKLFPRSSLLPTREHEDTLAEVSVQDLKS
jgi:hypothetical protein